ncbi:hypothetical protein [Halorussus litoreus]|uniref:hypothetical protein n=1 Tax=Halorussus litoreus TaxID=1710536 RepID=UPI000E269EB9|nr:hypothetical protein [Halorussus litoreus]
MVSLPSNPALTIALGVLLLANPLYVGHLHLDDPNWYRYESSEVTYDGSSIDVDIHVDGVDDDVACLAAPTPSRACALEYAVHEDGNLTAPVGWGHIFTRNYGRLGYRYAFVEDGFYEVEAREVGDETVLSLNRTPADEAMRSVATPISRAAPQVRQAIRSESVKTHQPLDGANQLIRDGNTYYVVYRAAAHIESGPHPLRNLLESGVTAFGMGVGLWLVLKGQRRRIERERQ